ncbi:NDT80/PhoG like DNA-binding family protein [Microdochium trichocladiopsis]|uniref:NDT80/PhoG like DNA-binding family protein n=1 Tax=Microdochium trichocladiopsis TaxID=1682393 RepID=A0A9P8Y8H9_9PEZI|nr:NDT80/PhoG like DNA-binding family protein [Microdochium trichocladiopsis]KAH7032928.1 NDT80/PhoG like DNA-binding family protein [Microdochium trichocladiopsis]
MAELKPESTQGGLWSNYGASVPLSARFPSAVDNLLTHPSSNPSQHVGRSRAHQGSIDHSYPYSRYQPEEHDTYARQQQPQHTLAPQHGYHNLKRPYDHVDQPAYQEIVQDLRDDGSKLTVNHDQKLLSFRKVQDKHTIVDQHGRMQQLELSAQLHGMFFLSEMPASTGEGSMLQPELTCYRRNLFQISGSLVTPRGQLSVILAESGETVAVTSTEVTISAIESVDGNPVRLIVIPWKTPPPNSQDLPQSSDQEPPPLPLIPFSDEGQEIEGELAMYPIGWRRLQFRIATANNGRRKELQQHFVLHLKVVGTLANGTKAVLTESHTAPIVVRGRSPRNFQARKEIPLLGSSAGSRGQALVESGIGIVAGPLPLKPQDPKARGLNLELPRTAFTFNASKLPGSPMNMRSNSYPSWNPSSHLPLSQGPVPASTAYPTSSADSYHKLPLSAAPAYSAEQQELPLQSPLQPVGLNMAASDHNSQQQPHTTMRAAYNYTHATSAPPPLSIATTALSGSDHGLNVPRYVDSSSRPAKSPRHPNQQSVHSIHSSGALNNDSSSEYRFGPSSYVQVSTGSAAAESYGSTDNSHTPSPAVPHPPSRDFYPPTATWTTSAGEANNTTVSSYTNVLSEAARPYGFTADPYKSSTSAQNKNDHASSSHYSAGMHNYSWSPTH